MSPEDELFKPVTPLPYSRIEPWSLAPWLTGIIVALVIFVILIPALCSACYHYYSYKVISHKLLFDAQLKTLNVPLTIGCRDWLSKAYF